MIQNQTARNRQKSPLRREDILSQPGGEQPIVENTPGVVDTNITARPLEQVPPPTPSAAYTPEAAQPSPIAEAIPPNPLTAPFLAQLKQNQMKRELLRTAPVTKRDGSTGTSWSIFADPTATPEIQQKQIEAATRRYTDQDGRLKSAAKMALAELAKNPLVGGARNWGDLLAGLAGAGGAGIGGAIHPAANEEQNRLRDLQKLDYEDAQIKDSMNTRISALQRETGIQNVIADNDRANAALDVKKQQDFEKGRQNFLKGLYAGKVFDPKTASDFQKSEAQRFGINIDAIGKFDLSNPIFKQIGDTTYKYNNSTGEFEETNLPKDGSKKLVDFQVTMPGETSPRTFKVSEEKAAGFTTQMRAAGIQAELAEKRLNETIRSNQVNENFRSEKFKADYGLAKERIALIKQNYQLAVDKFKSGSKGVGSEASGQLKISQDNARNQVIKTRKAILDDQNLNGDEKRELLDLLPELGDEQ